MWVVKLGGSLFESPLLTAWVAALEALPGPLVVVPGGGPFADTVRAAQRRWHFDDAAAHEMALYAMAQYGRMLTALAPSLTGAGLERLEAPPAAARRVWLPAGDVARLAGLPASWSVTSDSLALWLARRLDARGLLLVKACAVPRGEVTAAQLAREGVVDEAFPELLRGWRRPCLLAGPMLYPHLRALAAADAAPWPGAVAVAS